MIAVIPNPKGEESGAVAALNFPSPDPSALPALGMTSTGSLLPPNQSGRHSEKRTLAEMGTRTANLSDANAALSRLRHIRARHVCGGALRPFDRLGAPR